MLSDAQLQALRDAVAQGPGEVQSKFVAKYFEGFDKYNGWAISTLGRYGTDYTFRAMIDKVGLGAPRPEVAMYPLALLDHDRSLADRHEALRRALPGEVRPPAGEASSGR